jgi:superfamily II DNA or RNA helicase
MKCLDEGVDVPSARQAIIMASTGNPKQFIQRRGRVLRKDPASGKTRAVIWDFVVVPKLHPDTAGSYFKLERAVLQRQLRRVQEFAADSVNPADTTLVITDIKIAYRIA